MEHLREYQDYVLAYRLRALVGGKTRPSSPYLELSNYAQKRLRRQELARALVGTADYHSGLREVERLTDELNFGFWHNPAETIDFLRRTIEQGGSVALESRQSFIESLLTPLERNRLSTEACDAIARYYLGLLYASAAYLDAEVFTRLRGEVEPLRESLPVFVLPE